MTAETFKKALLLLRDRGVFQKEQRYLALLQFQFAAPGRTVTASEMAGALGLANYSGANLFYGTFAHMVADLIGFHAERRDDGTPVWWPALATGNKGSGDEHFQFTMRPALAEALIQMKWVRQRELQSP